MKRVESPPKEKAGCNTGPLQIQSTSVAILTEQLRQIKGSTRPGWITLAEWILARYVRTGSQKHLLALTRHLDGIHTRTEPFSKGAH